MSHSGMSAPSLQTETAVAIADREAHPNAALPPARRRRRRRGWRITLLALLLVATSAATLAVTTVGQPAYVALQFCADLAAQRYSAAYGHLAQPLRMATTATQYADQMRLLDTIEGRGVACALAANTPVSATPFHSAAAVQVLMARQGTSTLRGAIHLVDEDGVWRVRALDTALLGVSPGAVQAASDFCAALRAKRYATAYSFINAPVSGVGGTADFVAATALWDQVEGLTTGCAVVHASQPNDDTVAHITLHLTRGTSERLGAITLTHTLGAWTISAIDQVLLGRDPGPFALGSAFCQDLVNRDFHAAFLLFSDAFKALEPRYATEQAFTFDFAPMRWASCAPRLETYQVTTTEAFYDVDVTAIASDTGASGTLPLTYYFVKQDGAWKLGFAFRP